MSTKLLYMLISCIYERHNSFSRHLSDGGLVIRAKWIRACLTVKWCGAAGRWSVNDCNCLSND